MFGKFLLRTIVGLGVFVLFGGKDALGFLFMAVICTYGLGLIVVMPAAYLLGLLCTIWFIPFGNRREDSEEQSRPSLEQRHVQPAKVGWKHSPQGFSALQDYIAAAEAKGQEWDTIREELINSGWDEQTIASAWWRLNQTKENDY